MANSENLIRVLARDADLSDCREILREGSRSFYAASLLLPTDFSEPVTALYAFCRTADDAVDLAEDPLAGLQDTRDRLNRIYAGKPRNSAVDRAFAEVVNDFAIPYTLPAALLEGFEWDVRGRRYRSLSGTYAYAARVAGTVGAMMAVLMGVRDKAVLSRACDLGVAMQLTNIARDVGEDARNGRVYLPLERLRHHGVDVEAWIAEPTFNTGVRRTVFELLDAADTLYKRAEWGICQLPARVRPAIFAARSIYAEIGREIERRHYDSVSQRAVVSGRRKLRLLGGALRKALVSRQKDHAPTLAETRFLVDAVTQTA